MHFPKILLPSLLFYCSSLFAQSDSLHYSLGLVPLKDRTDLIVRLNTSSKVPLQINSLQDKYGLGTMDDFIRYIKPLKGEWTASEDSIIPNSQNEIQIEYRLSYDPEILRNYTYSPNTGRHHFHAFNCQWMICLGDKDNERHYFIEFSDLPQGWQAYNSFAEEGGQAEITDAYESMYYRIIGATEAKAWKFSVKAKPVKVFINGEYQISDSVLARTASTIIRAQRQFFDDYDFPFFNVVVLPKEENVAGINIPSNSFVCYVKPNVSLEKFSWIIAHEVFHTWLGSEIALELEEGSKIYRDHWFTEGFTDFFANKILRETEIINERQYVEAVNQYLLNIADNPYAHYSLAELETMAVNGNYGVEVIKLQYYRGALIALNAEAELKKANSKQYLGELMKQLLSEVQNREEDFSRQELFRFFDHYGVHLEDDYKNYILKGLPIVPNPLALGPGYSTEETRHRRFYLGFNLFKTQEKEVLYGVEKNGPAYQAGLRDGMKFQNISNYIRFGAGWEEDSPVSVEVRQGETTKVFQYFPVGEEIRVLQFVEN